MGVVNRRILEEDCARGDSSSTRPNPARKRPYEWPETARQTGGRLIKTGVNRAPEIPPLPSLWADLARFDGRTNKSYKKPHWAPVSVARI